MILKDVSPRPSKNERLMLVDTYKRAMVCYAALFLVLTSVFWVGGEVLSPVRQFADVGGVDRTGSHHLENHNLTDFNRAYIPEIIAHLKGKRSGWLGIWTGQNELGRPTHQLFGLSPAYFPSWMIMRTSEDPFAFITILSLATCFLAGLFIILLCQEWQLAPMAALVTAITLAASPYFMFWLTFPMFISAWCWSLGALWAITRLTRTADLLTWSALAFAVYSLLMTGYPQLVVLNSYLLVGCALYLAVKEAKVSRHRCFCFIARCISAAFVGTIFVFPVYADLLLLQSGSGRVSPEAEFFISALPPLDEISDIINLLYFGLVPELFRSSVSGSYPPPNSGISITVLAAFFIICGIGTTFRRIWLWWLAVFLIVLFAAWNQLYHLGVHYLGFSLSRNNPLNILIIPLTAILAISVDDFLKSHEKREWRIAGAAAFLMGVTVLGSIYGMYRAVEINLINMVLIIILIITLGKQYKKANQALIFSSVLMSMLISSYPLILSQNRNEITTSSVLTETMRRHLPDGSRYAVVSGAVTAIPPNFNAAIGMSSIHSYNSLSSWRYHRLIKELGGEMFTYGRWNTVISPEYESDVFWMSNIGLILSSFPLSHGALNYVGEVSDVFLYSVRSRMGEAVQAFGVFSPLNENLVVENLKSLEPRRLMKARDEGDLIEFDLEGGGPSVVVLSQKFHSNWYGTAQMKSGWQSVETVAINNIFQGVLLPDGATRVRIEFRPYSRFAWIGHAFWMLLLSVVGIVSWRGTIRQRRLTAG